MIPYPDIKPYIIKIGPLQLRWYGVMYLLGFASSYLLVNYQIKKKGLGIERRIVDDLYFYIILGLILGARFGYVLFYNFAEYLQNPLEIFAVWHGGMSFHGGLIGSVFAGICFCRKRGLDSWQVADLVIATAPIGLGLGRIGNFINCELYGRVSNVPWAMVFPCGGGMPRHPSQLYEAFFEGVVLFIVLWYMKDRIKITGGLTALFLILYGVIRFSIEFFREPDAQLGFVVAFLTMGQILSLAMVLVGIMIFLYRTRRAGV
ncbi:Prolipoprotein diacylglyceryl transferase [hydrothermal vent metagenome]|uniref:Prolipoprotein diacylglyceryl transferase n=1 Tax=hydrothermal vent metagenome TaxID=652676 RepID=A0A3B1D0J6_9ZZZZ